MGMKYKLAITQDRTVEESYRDLAGAVIGQAIKDYRLALKAYLRGDEKRTSELSTGRSPGSIASRRYRNNAGHQGISEIVSSCTPFG